MSRLWLQLGLEIASRFHGIGVIQWLRNLIVDGSKPTCMRNILHYVFKYPLFHLQSTSQMSAYWLDVACSDALAK